VDEENELEHLDPTTELTLDLVKKRAVKGVAVLTGRTFILSAISLVATGFLTVFLSPSEFGVFWIVSAIVNFLAYFSDVGLAAALIQKKEGISNDDLKTTFTVQQFLVLTLLLILFLLTPLFQKLFFVSGEGRLLLYALGFSLLLSSLKTIPSVLLERNLEFPKLVIPQVLENLVYNLSAVFLAWHGFGIRSFTYAVLIRGVVGLITIYILKPWKPGIAFHRGSLKKLLTFGVPYQVNTFLATIKDDGMTVFLGRILGTSGLGLLGWAQKWAYTPLRLFLDHVLKVTFPAFSRMQDEKDQLERSVTRSIFFVCFLVFPLTAGLLIIAPLLVRIIPRYEKWEPALIPLALISVNTFFAASTSQLTNLLNAIGKIKITFRLMVMWTALTWLFVPWMAIHYGVNGAALGYAIVGISSLIAIYFVVKIVRFSIWESIGKPLVSTVIMVLILFFIRNLLAVNILSVGILICMGFVIYFAVIYLLVGRAILNDAKRSYKAVFFK
jgi:O-antigen/teichoic acid export membrane protein